MQVKALNLFFTFGSQHSRIQTVTSCLATASSSSSSSVAAAAAAAAQMSTNVHVEIDPFCFRQFAEHESSKSYSGTVFSLPMRDFCQIVNQRYSDVLLKDGYAPFCKHLFLENDFTDAKVNVMPITKENEHLLRSRYEARNERELPVLMRYFPREILLDSSNGITLPVAKYLDLILYSRQQIEKENAAQGVVSESDMDDGEQRAKAPWGIVSIKAQDVPHELPMTPITAMRNALGKEEGGSGIPLDREQYMEAYNYWNTHAIIS